jgi:hypothetical protein
MFINILSNKPYKLKQGFLDYWVPIFLLANRDLYAIYNEDNYIPEINSDIFDLLNKKPSLFSIKAFDVDGIKLELFNRYRVFLSQSENTNPSNKAFIQTIKPFLVFYRDLPEYAKKTTRLESKVLALRKVISTAKDPEKAFFEDFPLSLGYNPQEFTKDDRKIEKFITELQLSIRKIQTCYDELVDRFENHFIKNVLGIETKFPEYQKDISQRFKRLKVPLLLANQKTVFIRLQSVLDDKKAWLSSIAQSCIGKTLGSITDEDEDKLFERIKEIMYELDNLSEISIENVDDDKEDVVKVEVTSFLYGLKKNTLRIPKGKNKAIDAQVKIFRSNLGEDNKSNIAALTKLLQELIK